MADARKWSKDRLPMETDLSAGDRVTWLFQPRCPGGEHGYTIPVPAEVVGINEKTIRIKAMIPSGGFRMKNVRRETLVVSYTGDHGAPGSRS